MNGVQALTAGIILGVLYIGAHLISSWLFSRRRKSDGPIPGLPIERNMK